MRIVLAALALLAAGSLFDAAKADPYRGCAEYGGRGGRNCYFITLEQCRWAISGNGGMCTPNPFYDGIPVDGQPRAPRPRTR